MELVSTPAHHERQEGIRSRHLRLPQQEAGVRDAIGFRGGRQSTYVQGTAAAAELESSARHGPRWADGAAKSCKTLGSGQPPERDAAAAAVESETADAGASGSPARTNPCASTPTGVDADARRPAVGATTIRTAANSAATVGIAAPGAAIVCTNALAVTTIRATTAKPAFRFFTVTTAATAEPAFRFSTVTSAAAGSA